MSDKRLAYHLHRHFYINRQKYSKNAEEISFFYYNLAGSYL